MLKELEIDIEAITKRKNEITISKECIEIRFIGMGKGLYGGKNYDGLIKFYPYGKITLYEIKMTTLEEIMAIKLIVDKVKEHLLPNPYF